MLATQSLTIFFHLKEDLTYIVLCKNNKHEKAWRVFFNVQDIIQVIQQSMQAVPLLHFQPTVVADRMFYKSFVYLRQACLIKTIYLVIQGLGLAGLILYLNLNNQGQNEVDPRINNALVIMIVASLYGFLIKTVQLKIIYARPVIYLAIAQATNHLVLTQNVYGLQSIQQCTSQTIFSAQTMQTQEAMSQQTKKLLQRITTTSINTTIKSRIRLVRSSQSTFALLSIASLIYDIVVMATVPMDTLSIVIFSVYCAIVVFSELLLILLLIALMLLPIICCGACIYVCCCKRNVGNVIDLPEREATTTDILNVGGDCSICFQSIGVNEKIYVLNCSEKHVFHSSCLSAWVKVKPSCPNCRQEIPMRFGA